MKVSTDEEVKDFKNKVASCKKRNHTLYQESSFGGSRYPGISGSGIVGTSAHCLQCQWSGSIRVL